MLPDFAESTEFSVDKLGLELSTSWESLVDSRTPEEVRTPEGVSTSAKATQSSDPVSENI